MSAHEEPGDAGPTDDAATTGAETEPAGTGGEATTIHPTLRPTLLWLGLTLAVGLGAVAYVSGNPTRFGGPETARIARDVLVLLTAILTVRFLVRAYVLRRTTYHVTPSAVTREYALLLRSTEREVPFSMVRSHELTQSRVERLLGYGTVSLNQGLGGIELENVPSPRAVHETVRTMVEREG